MALPLALFASPFLLVRLAAPRRGWIDSLAFAGAASVALNTAVPLILHLAGVPLTRGWLGLSHGVLTLLLLGLLRWRKRKGFPSDTPTGDLAGLLGLALVLTILLFPVTHLTGIDTYKWQDLAQNVERTGRIPWLVQPRSLFGFTPRSYPSAQPLLLASIGILGGMGVDAGFYVLSVLTGWIGIGSTAALGQRVFAHRPGLPALLAAVYVLSPVFMRYTYWATGRGLFLALLPLGVWAVVTPPGRRAVAGFAVMAGLLLLTHKTALVAVPLLAVTALGAGLVPRRTPRMAAFLLFIIAAAMAIPFTPSCLLPGPAGHAAGAIRMALSRLGWMLPLAGFGLMAIPKPLAHDTRRRLFIGLLLTTPAALANDLFHMYGAMIALPFAAVFAVDGVEGLIPWFRPIRQRHGLMIAGVLALTLAGAVTTLAHQARDATSHRVYEAARFLDHYDPHGPFVIESPAYARTQIQAYVGGCPRFEVDVLNGSRRHPHPPPLRGPVREWFRAWTGYLRFLFGVSDVETHWYGRDHRVYYVTIDGQGPVRPPDTVRLYDRDGIVIDAPAPASPSADAP